MESNEPSNVWTEVEKVFGSITDLHFLKPLCVLDGEGCVRFPTDLYCLPCSCTICNNCYMSLSCQELKCPLHGGNYQNNEVKEKKLTVQDISSREVKCQEERHGCNFVGQLSDLESHDCIRMETPCPLDCEESVPKMNLYQHVSAECANQVVQCSKCGMDIAHSAKDKHEENCNCTLQPCEMCQLPIKSNEVEQHMEICYCKIVPCKFSTLGCTVKDKRVNIGKHEDITNHIDIFIAAFNQTKQISDDVKELKELLTKMPSSVVKETVESAMEDMKQEFQILREKTIMDLTSNISTTHKEDQQISSLNSSSLDVPSVSNLVTNNDASEPVNNEVIQKMNIFFSDISEKFENSLKECCTTVKCKSMECLEQKMRTVLEESEEVDPLVQYFNENLSEVLKLMMKVCQHRSETVLKYIMSNLQHETEMVKDMSSIDGDEKLNIPEESTLIKTFDNIADGIMEHFGIVTNTVYDCTKNTMLQIHQQILLSASKKFEKDLEKKVKEIIATNMKEISSNVGNFSKTLLDQVSQNAQKEIANYFANSMKEITSNFESIAKKSTETINEEPPRTGFGNTEPKK